MEAKSFEQVKQLVTEASEAEVVGINYDIYNLASRNPVLFVDVVPIINFILGRVNTVVTLTKMGSLWDAEIILRTVLESFAKFLKIASQENDVKYDAVLDEFWIILDEIERIAHSDKAKEVINSGKNTTPGILAQSVLSKEEEDFLKSKPSWSNRKDRIRIKNDWSFSAIMIDMLKREHTTPLISFEMMQYYYKMSSHVAHGDMMGINFVRGYDKKEGDYKSASEVTLYIKQLKVATQIPFWISVELAKMLNDRDKVNEILAKYRKYTRYVVGLHEPVMVLLDKLTHEYIDDKNIRNEYFGPLRPI